MPPQGPGVDQVNILLPRSLQGKGDVNLTITTDENFEHGNRQYQVVRGCVQPDQRRKAPALCLTELPAPALEKGSFIKIVFIRCSQIWHAKPLPKPEV